MLLAQGLHHVQDALALPVVGPELQGVMRRQLVVPAQAHSWERISDGDMLLGLTAMGLECTEVPSGGSWRVHLDLHQTVCFWRLLYWSIRDNRNKNMGVLR